MRLLVTGGAGFEPALLHSIEERSDRQKKVLFDKVNKRFNGDLAGRSSALRDLSFKPSTDDLSLCGTKEAALKEADALIIVTEWQEFRTPDFDFIKQALKEPVIFDGRNMYAPRRMARRGLGCYSVRGS